MARADLLLDLVRAGARGERDLFRKTLEALVAEERAKQHHILADRLAAHLNQSNNFKSIPAPSVANGPVGELFYEINPNRQLEDLVLSDAVTNACKEMIEEQSRSDLLRSHNLEPRHRVLLAGPPGNGKTSLAEALANELALPLLVVRYESIIKSYLGETAVRVARLFDQVRTRRAVLFFDEFDVVGKERGDVHETGEIKRVVSSLLLQVDALPSYVIVVTATNHPELLDRAVWRRFQLRLQLPPPTLDDIGEWFSRFEKRRGLKFQFNPKKLSKSLSGLSFSELEQFSLDVQRRYVMALPDANITRIVNERLSQWENRFSINNKQ
ncbi:MAG: ATP-binding protein [Deltaproteobacteria bacterium]|nr:ATP-binding protein [Deltaproteobacteria bacterium]